MAWRNAHRAEHNAAGRAWKLANKERRNLSKRVTESKRRAAKRGTDGRITIAEWLAVVAAQHSRCWWCLFKTKLTMDHVVPLSKGGVHAIGNIVGACQRCNSAKKDRLWVRENGGLANGLRETCMH